MVLMEPDSLFRVGTSMDPHELRNEEVYEWKGHPEAVPQTLTSSAVTQVLSQLETNDTTHQADTQRLLWCVSSLRAFGFIPCD
jgi:hypothetical protein